MTSTLLLVCTEGCDPISEASRYIQVLARRLNALANERQYVNVSLCGNPLSAIESCATKVSRQTISESQLRDVSSEMVFNNCDVFHHITKVIDGHFSTIISNLRVDE